MIGEVVYRYQPQGWSREEFLRQGGFTAVFLNYNKAAMIRRSVESVLQQDFPALDILLMDDASTDGSGDMMESLAREYRGRHRVRVVRNSENQYITGQWNIAAKLAEGQWLGMFCGDDVAHADRVSLAAERIRKYPTLLGFSTASVDIDSRTGLALPDSHYVPRPYFATGTDSPESLALNFASNGATSFWHISLFKDLLPRVDLDDDYLHMRAYVLGRGVDAPIFFYDSDIKTIDYSIGCGVTAGNGSCAVDKKSWPGHWRDCVRRQKHLASMAARTLVCALDYAKEKGTEPLFVRAFDRAVLCRKIKAGDTVKKLFLTPKIILYLVDWRCGWHFRKKLLKVFSHDFVLEFFGLRMASYFSLLKHSVSRT